MKEKLRDSKILFEIATTVAYTAVLFVVLLIPAVFIFRLPWLEGHSPGWYCLWLALSLAATLRLTRYRREKEEADETEDAEDDVDENDEESEEPDDDATNVNTTLPPPPPLDLNESSTGAMPLLPGETHADAMLRYQLESVELAHRNAKLVAENNELMRRLLEDGNSEPDSEPEEDSFVRDESLSPDFEDLPRWVQRDYPLKEGPSVIAFTRVHWLKAFPPVATAIAATIGIWWIFFAFFSGNSTALCIHLGGWLAIILVTGIAFLKHLRHVYVWDSDAIVHYRGILTINVATVDYSKITDLEVQRPFLGRIFNYWHLRVETAGQEQVISREHFLSGNKEMSRYISRYVGSRKS